MPKRCQRLLAITDDHHAMAGMFEQGAGEERVDFIVFGNQHAQSGGTRILSLVIEPGIGESGAALRVVNIGRGAQCGEARHQRRGTHGAHEIGVERRPFGCFLKSRAGQFA